jgi:hypothetical protein
MTIRGIKLVTGEEIIADVENSGDNRYKLTNPVQIRVVPPQVAGGSPSMGFMPFPSFGKESAAVVIEPLHVVYLYEPVEDIVSNYNSFFSGIITPSSKQIITG